MKVGIITKIGKNYGAILQAYALKQACDSLGFDTQIIQYTPDTSRRSYRVCPFIWGPRGSIMNLKALLHFVEYRQATKRFFDFRNKHFNFTPVYYKACQLNHQPPVCDIYITGSDQVWNPQILFDDVYYLSFANPKQSRLVSYAASIGLSNLPENLKPQFKQRLSRLHDITVREQCAQRLLQEMDISSSVVPDPTLLFTQQEWNTQSRATIRPPYILCYFVSVTPGVKKIIQQVQKSLNYPVVNLMLNEKSAGLGNIRIRNAGPQEFLGLFQNASFVITSSFHGTIFSVLNQKPFVTTLYQNTQSRVQELLSSLQLQHRIISPANTNIAKYITNPTYTPQSQQKLLQLRQVGWKELRRILQVRIGENNE